MLISKSSGTGSLDGTENNGKGTYTATVTSPKTAGSGTFTATTEWGLSMMTILFVGVALWDSIRSRKSRQLVNLNSCAQSGLTARFGWPRSNAPDAFVLLLHNSLGG